MQAKLDAERENTDLPENAPAPGVGESAASGDGADAPRPHTPDEIVALMDEAAARAKQKKTRSEAPTFWDVVAVSALWGGVFVAFASIIFVVLSAPNAGAGGLVLAGGLAFLIAVFLIGAAMRLFSPVLLTSALMRRATGKPAKQAAELAGAEILDALGLAGPVLDADIDARLVTRRDGVVTYANRSYIDLAGEAGVFGASGLPPRIDRLFAQQGAEATKVFRLCRAAKGGEAGDETIYQVMGLEGGGERRRFAVSVRPVGDAGEHMSWLLREMPIEEDAHDMLAAAYADFPAPVFAVEKSGQIAWTNASMRGALGAARGALLHIDDVVLGDTSDVVRGVWKIDGAPIKATVRRAGEEPVEATLSAFRRGGVGEGFVCVSLNTEDEEAEEEDVSLSGDIREAPFGVAVVEGEFSADAKLTEANKAFLEMAPGAGKKPSLAKVFPPDALEELVRDVRRRTKAGANSPTIEANLEIDGVKRTYALFARPVRRRRGSYGARRTLLYSVDVTEQKLMEAEHAQDRKLKGIGQIASKVAHDYNNYLQGIMGPCDQLMLKHPVGDPAYPGLVQIRENAQRAANVTKQLLAFSRRQTLKREVQSITELLRDFSRFLDRSIGEKVTLELINGRGLPPLKIDRFQLETAIMNLAVNARDAMAPKGGKLTITTKHIKADEVDAIGAPDLAEEDHVLIEVADTGPGVPDDIVDKIFDPFFTTKELGKGTGLGLSTVYGIIGQMGGVIQLENAPDKGAVFKIYLPAYDGAAAEDETADVLGAEEGVVDAAGQNAAPSPVDLTGAGRVLVVEDEDSVRKFVVSVLDDCGYDVTYAEDGDEALEILEEENERFDLVISDVMMPVMNGPVFVDEARRNHGLTAKVIFMSGYAEAGMREELDTVETAGYIQKPFSLHALASAVKQAMADEASETAKAAGV